MWTPFFFTLQYVCIAKTPEVRDQVLYYCEKNLLTRKWKKTRKLVDGVNIMAPSVTSRLVIPVYQAAVMRAVINS